MEELAVNEWLVKWKNMFESEATWESIYLMKQQFPDFHLENEVDFKRGNYKAPDCNYI